MWTQELLQVYKVYHCNNVNYAIIYNSVVIIIHSSVESTATITQSTSATLNLITSTIATLVPAPFRYESAWPDSASFTTAILFLVGFLITLTVTVLLCTLLIFKRKKGVSKIQVAPAEYVTC